MKTLKPLSTSLKILVMVVLCLVIIAGGAAGMKKMIDSKKAPFKKPQRPRGLFVKTMPVVKEDVALIVTGYGQAEPVDTVSISPEVSGKIIRVTLLKQGETIQKGAPLFIIDDTDYQIAKEQANIQVTLKKNQAEQLKISYQQDKDRLAIVKQNTQLANANWTRLKDLYENNRVGSLSTVESAEQNYNSLLNTEKNLIKSIELYPLQIREAESSLADALSNLETARLNVERCRVTAPFTGRIKDLETEQGAYITKGSKAMVMADDSSLEIRISLSDKEAFELLNLEEMNRTTGTEPTACTVETVTGNITAHHTGFVHRIVCYDPDTRTLTLAVRVPQEGRQKSLTNIPLMDGMFCRVDFKGKTIKDTVKIPGPLLNMDNTIYISQDQKLKTLKVVNVMEDGDDIYVTGDFTPSDQIIITPLANPVENQMLNIAAATETEASKLLAFKRSEQK